ncbi:hypothetical protein CPB84DRAFT_1852210 [Gymnopilus junonius]|uniref:Uncharacterized protein n=1 Tax=Gymnopilus junonius TaxID=109634 RepID=A0A9P5NDE7_GYMJU|nr:hypothetical protein CPB84DRAFT_1852210 [Gymnopilus junonius]
MSPSYACFPFVVLEHSLPDPYPSSMSECLPTTEKGPPRACPPLPLWMALPLPHEVDSPPTMLTAAYPPSMGVCLPTPEKGPPVSPTPLFLWQSPSICILPMYTASPPASASGTTSPPQHPDRSWTALSTDQHFQLDYCFSASWSCTLISSGTHNLITTPDFDPSTSSMACTIWCIYAYAVIDEYSIDPQQHLQPTYCNTTIEIASLQCDLQPRDQ